MSDILQTILARKAEEIAERRSRVPLADIAARARDAGPVRGFATTLSIGILTSMFSALVVTRVLIHLWLEKGVDSIKMRQLVKETHIRFVDKWKIAATLSTVVLAAGVVLFVSLPDNRKLGIDFLGGVTLTVRTERPQPVQGVRDRVAAIPGVIGRSAEVKAVLASGDEGEGYRQFRVTFKTEGGSREADEAEEAIKDTVENEVRSALAGILEKGPYEVRLDAGAATGTLYFERPHPEEDVAAVLRDRVGLADVTVERVTGPAAAYSFRGSAPLDKDLQALTDLVERRFEGAPDSRGVEFAWAEPIPEVALVGAQVVSEIRDKAIFAILLSLFVVVMYIRVRFAEYSFGYAAVVALIHDVLFTLGALAVAIRLDLFEAEINLPMIAAFLTIIGYSLNDTIVIFDRIRENLPRTKGTLAEIIDLSINQTLSRTLLTSGTTLVTVLFLLGFNYGANSALEGFAFILTFGLIAGTYSTIFIASPTLLYLPWLWERCGGNARSLARRAAPYMIVTAAVLIGAAYIHGKAAFARDWTMPVFNNLFLAIPVGLLAFFLWNFVVFVRSERVTAEDRSAAPVADSIDDLALDAEARVVFTDHDAPGIAEHLAHVLRSSAGFVGVMGSRRHVGPYVDELRAMGFGEEDLARVRSPLGLDLGGRRPEEIALSIAAGLVADSNARGGGWLDR